MISKEMIEEKERTRMKIDFFIRNDKPIHIKKYNGEWLNGHITGISDDFITLDEFVRGEIMVFLVDIRDIVLYEIKKEDDKDLNILEEKKDNR